MDCNVKMFMTLFDNMDPITERWKKKKKNYLNIYMKDRVIPQDVKRRRKREKKTPKTTLLAYE